MKNYRLNKYTELNSSLVARGGTPGSKSRSGIPYLKEVEDWQSAYNKSKLAKTKGRIDVDGFFGNQTRVAVANCWMGLRGNINDPELNSLISSYESVLPLLNENGIAPAEKVVSIPKYEGKDLSTQETEVEFTPDSLLTSVPVDEQDEENEEEKPSSPSPETKFVMDGLATLAARVQKYQDMELTDETAKAKLSQVSNTVDRTQAAIARFKGNLSQEAIAQAKGIIRRNNDILSSFSVPLGLDLAAKSNYTYDMIKLAHKLSSKY